MSYMFTANMIKLRSLTWYNNSHPYNNVRSKTFIDTDGVEFTGYYGITKAATHYPQSRPATYSASILARSPVIYISSDKTVLSRDDYSVPDDAIQISWSTSEQSVEDTKGVSTILHAYYSNDSEEDITVNKILIVGNIATCTDADGTSDNALLFEEFLDNPIVIAAGERWARNFEFRLEIN